VGRRFAHYKIFDYLQPATAVLKWDSSNLSGENRPGEHKQGAGL